MKMNKRIFRLSSFAVIAFMLMFSTTTAVVAKEAAAPTSTTVTITEQQARDIVTSAYASCTIKQIKLKNEDGVSVYKVSIKNSDGTELKVSVNSTNGTIVQKTDDSDNKTGDTGNQKNDPDKAAIKLQQQTLESNWSSYTAAQKETVYALKDTEFDTQIAAVQTHIAAGYKTQAEVDAIVLQIQAQKTEMRASGNAPKFDSLVNLPAV